MDLEEHSPHVFAPHACLEYDISGMAHRLHSIIERFYKVFRKYKVYQFVKLYPHRTSAFVSATASDWIPLEYIVTLGKGSGTSVTTVSP